MSNYYNSGEGYSMYYVTKGYCIYWQGLLYVVSRTTKCALRIGKIVYLNTILLCLKWYIEPIYG